MVVDGFEKRFDLGHLLFSQAVYGAFRAIIKLCGLHRETEIRECLAHRVHVSGLGQEQGCALFTGLKILSPGFDSRQLGIGVR
ncbi:hypothetical protein ALO38_200175 [Pseudomonas coronafaciens pv. zizaniae]|nr:hypothetical protein ALO38_200175 [Pseudomonas coronafaciens pv. zizaniae]